MDIFNSKQAGDSEQLGCLHSDWLKEIYAQKWFKLFVPKELNGLGLSLPEALEVEEKLARLDGSLGWTVTLCAGAAWFVGFFDPQLSTEVFENPNSCLAGSGFVGGKAEKKGEKYLISGHWTYASGVLHATHFTANCEIWEAGKLVTDSFGNPLVKAFVLKKDEIEILDAWHFMGMKATGSHAFKTDSLYVPENRCFEISPKKTFRPEPIYQFPFQQFAEATLAVNILGITFHLQSLLKEAFWKRNARKSLEKEYLEFYSKLERKGERKLEKVRSEFYQTIEKAWLELGQSGSISPKKLNAISKISRKMTATCRKWNSKLYPFAGLEAAREDSELNRVWRDFHTVSQHSLLIFPF
ncbi:MAG: acyl-CoA dehydrogenase [Algoriphagus sp.]|uniref:acyl-CoA dehydrogenase n=1 Tax=Algoriphagus sp. TaxID=1872435 RepID=UPI001849DB58|nr:acyl-CoA dehydrogenase [Algoriphagus sp.]NVJ85390.1 acyl-CoA dehydrogenase [Algoriphagus sp.]